MKIFIFILQESIVYAFKSLLLNRLRTFLSLFGITIGIFAIISVFTVIDSLENSIRESIATLGDDVVYVQKWPWAFGGDYPWWKYMKRPVITLKEKEEIARRVNNASGVAYLAFFQRTIQFEKNYLDNTQIVAASQEYETIKSFDLVSGRFFTPFESERGYNRAVIGYNIAEQLFQGANPVGKNMKIGGKKVLIVGVFQKEGSDMFEMSHDNDVIIPVNYAKTLVNLKDDQLGPMVMVKAKNGIPLDELIVELEGIMRAIRRLKPTQEDNFALNKVSLISQGFEQIFIIIDLAGLIIGGFSILVGGFGIANIMFVSVKEQTKFIGIQKALGAKRFFILLQFLNEAVMLTLIGGIIGLLLVFLLTSLISMISSMNFALSAGNIILGLFISVAVGIIAGIIPAQKASKLNPVVAINTN